MFFCWFGFLDLPASTDRSAAGVPQSQLKFMTSLRVISATVCLVTLCQASRQLPMAWSLLSIVLTQLLFCHLGLVSILASQEPRSSCLAPPLFLPGSCWDITSLYPVYKSLSLDHIASSCPNAGWLHPVPGVPSHLSICVLIIYPQMQWPHFSRLNPLNVTSCLGLLTSPGPF